MLPMVMKRHHQENLLQARKGSEGTMAAECTGADSAETKEARAPIATERDPARTAEEIATQIRAITVHARAVVTGVVRFLPREVARRPLLQMWLFPRRLAFWARLSVLAQPSSGLARWGYLGYVLQRHSMRLMFQILVHLRAWRSLQHL